MILKQWALTTLHLLPCCAAPLQHLVRAGSGRMLLPEPVSECACLSVWMRFPLLAQHVRKHTCRCMTSINDHMSVLPGVYKQRGVCVSVCAFVVFIQSGDFFSSPRTRTRHPSCRSRWQAGGTSCTFACAGRECCGSSCSVDRTHRGKA